ncbi:MAG: hypothetical protein CL596_05095 [Alteromonas sp.]|nr:hypothetical protein [Alteromonas sp.]|tara:strand:- start:22068 stop:22343 length:276 start_codon:yes stop_codon:yes gene_type:complete
MIKEFIRYLGYGAVTLFYFTSIYGMVLFVLEVKNKVNLLMVLIGILMLLILIISIIFIGYCILGIVESSLNIFDKDGKLPIEKIKDKILNK